MEASALGFVTASKQVQVVRNRTVEVQFELLPDVIGLEQVVVTGNKNEAVRRKSSSLVQVMSSKLLTDVGAVCIARTVVSRRCASTVWMVTILKF